MLCWVGCVPVYVVMTRNGCVCAGGVLQGSSCADTGSTATMDFIFGNYQAAEVGRAMWCVCVGGGAVLIHTVVSVTSTVV